MHPVGFKGRVLSRSKFSFSDRLLYAVAIENPDIQNADSIPSRCEFFTYSKNVLRFTAFSETVNRAPNYDLFEGFFVEKKVNSDTIFVFFPDGSPKYLFELFDGINSEWTPREWPR